jgi:DNA-binding transcriptional LysR family regulator
MEYSAFTTNLKSLECFRTIIDAGSVTAAGKRLNLTQPAVSRLLGLLESRIGLELFNRRNGRLIPTDEALMLYKEVDIALQSIERVSQLAKNLHNSDFGELTIVAPPSFAEGILSDVISRFLTQHPNLRIRLDSQSVEKARDMVALRAVDCGFIKLPADYPGITCTTMTRSRTVCALSVKHPLSKKNTLNVKDLQNEPLILLGKGKVSRLQIDQAFRETSVKMNVRVETHTVGAACAIARHGIGIAIVNEMLALQYADQEMVLRGFSPGIEHEYAFMTSLETPMNRVTRRFFEHCQDYFNNFRQNASVPK